MNAVQFNLTEVVKKQQQSGDAWLELFKVPSLSMGVYNVPAGNNDRESHNPHDRDEVYVVISGKGRLTADGEALDVETNSVVYVKAGVDHHFHDVTHDLTVLVFFAAQTETMDN